MPPIDEKKGPLYNKIRHIIGNYTKKLWMNITLS